MSVGICYIELNLDGCVSLKEKRRILKSIIGRIRNNFNVSVAEIDHNNLWQRSTLGIACISQDGRFINQQISKIIDLVNCSPEVNLIDYTLEIF
jgi:uncharacterized protein YlxP (DUF503 family)